MASKRMSPYLVTIVAVMGVLVGSVAPAPAISLYYNTASPPLNTWTTTSAPLSETGWRVNNYLSGPTPTPEQFLYVLTNLQGLFILTEWRTGPDDTNVDNVVFGTAASSSFATSSEGWVIAGPDPEFDAADFLIPTAPVVFDASFGNPAGSIRAGDVFEWTWVGAPASYLGNQSAQYGNTLSRDIFIRFTDNVVYPAFALVAPDTPLNVPEPATLALLVSAVAGLALTRRKR